MSTISRYKRDLKTGEKALIRSAVEEDAASLLENGKYMDSVLMYRFVNQGEGKS
jgi:hypothetical protein